MHSTPSLQSIYLVSHPTVPELHPEPRHIFRLWQTFVDGINPLLKVIHVPTLQQRITDASWDLAGASRSLTALMFAIYTLSVTSMSPIDCETSFGETRTSLLTRYRVATLRALVAAEYLTTREIEVLQALVLFLFADPDSDLSFTLTGVVVRLGQRMGLHKECTDPNITFFEKEMRVRLWWQLCGIDARIRSGLIRPPPSELGDVRPPLNINDADLHPDMTEPPIEHKGPTEMMCVLMKYEVTIWLRSSAKGSRTFQDIFRDETINEIQSEYHEKYLRHCDMRIPLHNITYAVANLALSQLRFHIHHPRGRVTSSSSEVYITSTESDLLFNSALTALEMFNMGIQSKFSQHLFTHLTSKLHLDTHIYVISELRQRCSGDRVALAWKMVGNLYASHPELIHVADNSFFLALGDLTLEAWEARRMELVRSQGVRESDITPSFIQSLWERRQSRNLEAIQASTMSDLRGFDSLGFADDNGFNWEQWNWNEFLQL